MRMSKGIINNKTEWPVMFQYVTFILFYLIATTPVWANVVELPDGHTVLNISATEKVEVAQDLLLGSLRIQEEEKEASEVQEVINTAMKKAVDLIKAYPNIKVQTGQYYVHPDYRYIKRSNQSDQQVIDKWRGSQTIIIKSKKSEEILEAAGKLQDLGFVMNSLNYQLSPEKYEEVRDGLMEKTIKALSERAKRVAAALGKKEVDLVEVNVDATSSKPPIAYARGAKMETMALSADMAMPAPVAEAGESTVSMTISAQAIIKP